MFLPVLQRFSEWKKWTRLDHRERVEQGRWTLQDRRCFVDIIMDIITSGGLLHQAAEVESGEMESYSAERSDFKLIASWKQSWLSSFDPCSNSKMCSRVSLSNLKDLGQHGEIHTCKSARKWAWIGCTCRSGVCEVEECPCTTKLSFQNHGQLNCGIRAFPNIRNWEKNNEIDLKELLKRI